jgi:hypothetical protein
MHLRRACVGLGFLVKKDLPHIPRLDRDADDLLASVKYLLEFGERAAEIELFDAIDRVRKATYSCVSEFLTAASRTAPRS